MSETTTTTEDFRISKICPKCGCLLLPGYGLAGGGMGPYWACVDNEQCDFFHKDYESPEEPKGGE